jgi:hypothetical protein
VDWHNREIDNPQSSIVNQSALVNRQSANSQSHNPQSSSPQSTIGNQQCLYQGNLL